MTPDDSHHAHDPVDAAVRAHYADQRPSPAALDRLRGLVAEQTAVQTPVQMAVGRGGWAVRALAVAAAVALAFLLGFLVAPDDDANFTASVHEEIALNHRKELGSEWPTTDLADLRASMDKLPFRLALPDTRPDLHLRGGRYCSIDGQLAAQLQLVDDTNAPCTLYVLADDPALAAVIATTGHVDGIEVKTWRESGLLYGLARSATQ
ncbi:MAG: hypothetical protein AAF743_11975 [Planctomycetota bacterium]